MGLLWLFSFVIFTRSMCSTHLHDSHMPHYGHELLKRWYGVKPLTEEKENPYSQPWPVTCTNPYIQPVRYCFLNERSAKNLGEIVREAIAIWAPAMQNSALQIELDPRAGGDESFRCSAIEGEKDMLVIWDNTDEELPPGQQTCSTSTTTGYYYTVGDNNKEPFRHQMSFCLLDPHEPDRDLAIRGMAHEFGHALGLSHEHQRPDRDQYLNFHCPNVAGYEKAQRRVVRDRKNLYKNPYDPEERGYDDFHEMTTEERWRDMCSDWTASRYYFPAIKTWLRTDQFYYSASAERIFFDTTEFSARFDYDSIMIYDSDAELGPDAPADAKIISRKPDDAPVYMGGSKELRSDDPDRKVFGVSAGDIARVAQLYPSYTPENEEAQKGGEWGAFRLRIRGGREVEMRPRNGTKRDEL